MITHQVFVEPCAVVVALPDEHVVLCHEVLGQAGLRVHRAEHVIAACEHITKLLPQVVVTPASLRSDVRSMIEDRAVAVGAVLATLEPTRDFNAIERDLHVALATVRELLGRPARSRG
jgi:hypothetical protein